MHRKHDPSALTTLTPAAMGARVWTPLTTTTNTRVTVLMAGMGLIAGKALLTVM